MSNHQEVTDLAKTLTGNENLYSVQPFIKITGDTLLGLFLERVVYWSDRSTIPRLKQLKIFYKTAGEWEEELGLSYAQITRARKTLESMGFIQTSKHRVAGAPTLHYYANIGAIAEAITKYYQSRNSGYTNINNPEIQEVSISEKSQGEVKETRKSEVQESLNSSYNSTYNSNSNSTKEGDKSPPVKPKRESVPIPAAVKVYQDIARRLPDKALWLDIETKVGATPENLKRWGDVIQAYIGCGWNKLNLSGMLSFYEQERIPSTEKVKADAHDPLVIPPPPDPIPTPPQPEHVTIWEVAAPMVRGQMTGATFDTLFKDARPVARENGTFELRVKASALEMIAARPRVKANVLTAIQAVKPEIHDLDFTTWPVEAKELTL